MMNQSRKDEAWYPGKQKLYKKINQSTMESWLNKTQMVAMLIQTQDTKTIRPRKRNEMLTPIQKLQARWKIRNNAIKENAPQQGAGKKEEAEYTKTAEKTEIMH